MEKKFTINAEPIEGTDRLRVTVPEIGASCETTENSLDAATHAGNQLMTEHLLAQRRKRTRQSSSRRKAS
jgi:hypothetical protein